eukprot:15234672-Alexandrium_andersonii.AAC.1
MLEAARTSELKPPSKRRRRRRPVRSPIAELGAVPVVLCGTPGLPDYRALPEDPAVAAGLRWGGN